MKDRPVIVVSPPGHLKRLIDPVIVVACSTTIREADAPDRVQMPTEADTPTCRTGLWQTCWAVPRWFLPVERARLNEYLGYAPRQKLIQILLAYERHKNAIP